MSALGSGICRKCMCFWVLAFSSFQTLLSSDLAAYVIMMKVLLSFTDERKRFFFLQGF